MTWNKLLATILVKFLKTVTTSQFFFFHSETNLKVLLAQLGMDPRPLALRPWQRLNA